MQLLEQTELEFEELESAATEDEIAAEQAAARTTNVAPFVRRRPARQPFPEHLPRERVVGPVPSACMCCGGNRLRKLGEDVTETLEVIPRCWKVVQHVREKFTWPRLREDQPPRCLHVYGVDADGVTAFTKYGFECLQQIIADKRAAGEAPPKVKSKE